ncbi:fumarylacetoacetate hydrolase family protein [Sphingomonas sp. M1-B02]|uniref:fumarylacetoacetate hydrolase family protein n=1 Tax=Sphingomonas sp. M1-B02 TaxID=3114300 RepID=UPI002240687F|nr:fumarylacetoacetate hydrolase family protein [Sphingomonas sp. S6-11]UZK65088.1 fumarylacetoacetate hydrolase family protein [Sphingomonas sp. S6-11]
MRLATLKRGGRDGTLVAVDESGTRVAPVAGYATLQAALDDWDAAQDALRAAADAAETGEAVSPEDFAAPLPRAWQWLDGSAFANHGALMELAFGHAPIETDKPLMYQGMSHQFIAPTDDVPLPSEADGIDFEGEFAIVTGDVPMGCPADQALGYVRLILLLNDWSLRAIAIPEMKTGFGWVQAKPACSVAPFAVTPDVLGEAWRNGRVCLPLTVEVDGEWFGNPNGAAMGYGFHELIAHAARSRSLPAGTIIGSGTVSNPEHEAVGSTCISERRAIEMIAGGGPQTPFLPFGSRVAMCAGEGVSPFGVIDQRVVAG